jgi:diguanylate cyclase (GGDEF)-like protein/PAS domain S-box-containing protein
MVAREHDRQRRKATAAVAALSCVGGVAYVLAYLFWLAVPFGSAEAQAFFADFAVLPVDVVVVVTWIAAGLARGGDRASRNAWLTVAAAMAFMTFGDIAYFWFNVVEGEAPFPSVADGGYLAFYALMLVGLLRFPSALRSRSDAVRFWLDAATIMVAGSLFVWQFVLAPTFDAQQTDIVSAILAAAYPVGDLLLLLGLSIAVLRRHGGTNRRAVALVAVGILLFFMADIGFAVASMEGGYLSGSWPDGLYVVATSLWAAAGFVGLWDASARRPEKSSVGMPGVSLVPYLAVVAGYALVVGVAWTAGDGSTRIVLGGVVLSGLVVARQVVAVRENIRLSREAEKTAGEERFRALIQHASDVITVVDADGTVRYQTPSVQGLLGRKPETLIGQSLASIVHADDRRLLETLLRGDSPGADTRGAVELRLLDAWEDWRSTETVCADLRAIPTVGGFVLTSRDLTERKALQARLESKALHDPLTGLPNRVLFHDRVEQALQRGIRHQTHAVVLFIDIDEFKRVNDSRGHDAGDQLLVAIGARIAGAIRGLDTAARLGGDEFAVLFEDVADPEPMIGRAERLCELLSKPYPVDGRPAAVTASLGLATAGPGSCTRTELLRNADMAMYAAKDAGRNRVMRYQPTMHAALLQRITLEADLREAVAAGEIGIHLQPIFEVATGKLIGAEALARWSHGDRGSVPPSDFIPVAENTGLIGDIGRRVLLDACMQARGWPRRDGSPAVGVSVNVSAAQLGAEQFEEDVRGVLARTGLPPECLTLEITESVLARDISGVRERLTALAALGVRLSIDDFGTGYSSLSYLQTFPVHEIKIDRSFVAMLKPDDPEHHVFVRAIVELARALNMATVAEGVERQDQLDVLRSIGCDMAQGYLIARPMPPGAFGTFLAEGGDPPGPAKHREPAAA